MGKKNFFRYTSDTTKFAYPNFLMWLNQNKGSHNKGTHLFTQNNKFTMISCKPLICQILSSKGSIHVPVWCLKYRDVLVMWTPCSSDHRCWLYKKWDVPTQHTWAWHLPRKENGNFMGNAQTAFSLMRLLGCQILMNCVMMSFSLPVLFATAVSEKSYRKLSLPRSV